jgi:hypothetical protein
MKRLTSIGLIVLCLAVCSVPVGASNAAQLPSAGVTTPGGGVTSSVTANREPSQFTAVSWNVDSGGADPHVVAVRMSEMKGVDLWGLCEVQDDHWARLFEQAASGTEPGQFARILSPTGGSDRSCILYDRTKFECLGSFEFSWAGQSWYRRDLGLRPGLVAHLRHRETKQDLYFMVNRFHGVSADKQAAMLSEWAGKQEIPVVAVGTYDFQYRPEATSASSTDRRGYPTLTANGVFQWLMPDNPVPTVWRTGLDAIDDFILLADSRHMLAGRSQVIVESDDFPDNEMTPNHRPISATLTIRPVAR